jgi:DNA-binding LacI/PurR family transcriptional regulator
MRDVARAAGVSPMTVSNVLSGYAHVRPETRDRVKKAVTDLDYRLNVAARDLRQGRSGIIAVAVSDVTGSYESMLAGFLSRQIWDAGFEPVIELTQARRAGELGAVRHSLGRRYDGLILHSSFLKESDLERVRSGNPPVVVLSEREYDEPLDQVLIANEDAARAATAHLIEGGAQRPGMVGGRRVPTDHQDVISSRQAGFDRALAEHGLVNPTENTKWTIYGLSGGREATLDLLDDYPDLDALFCATDGVALGALRALHERGRRVPDDVQVIGFDGIEMGQYAVPSLTTVLPDYQALVGTAVSLLVDRLSGTRPADQFRRERVGFRILQRESTGRG